MMDRKELFKAQYEEQSKPSKSGIYVSDDITHTLMGVRIDDVEINFKEDK